MMTKQEDCECKIQLHPTYKMPTQIDVNAICCNIRNLQKDLGVFAQEEQGGGYEHF